MTANIFSNEQTSAILIRHAERQMSSSRIVSASIATSDASKNVAENVPRLILLAIDASVSFMPYFLSRSANSRYPTPARAYELGISTVFWQTEEAA
jgi:hypothetical protein